MSRNPYLAASRPSSSYTRSSRSSASRSPLGAAGSSLGRSRSSASLGSQFSAATGGSSSYLASSYVPSTNINTNSRAQTSALRSNSSTRLASMSSLSRDASNDSDMSDSSHLKNYQQNKLQQANPSPTTRSTSSRVATVPQSQSSLDRTNSSSSIIQTNDNRTTTMTTTTNENDPDDVAASRPIGESIPSASARHLRSSQSLNKSKSIDLGANKATNEMTSLISSSMSVDRLLLRAESMDELDLRKSFKELVLENERLKSQVRGFIEDKDKQLQQEWIKKERQLQRKISELEEENKQMEQWKKEIQRLKDENSSLIRVVSKLSKQ